MMEEASSVDWREMAWLLAENDEEEDKGRSMADSVDWRERAWLGGSDNDEGVLMASSVDRREKAWLRANDDAFGCEGSMTSTGL